MNTSEHDCQDLAATGLILTFLFQDLVSQVLKCCYIFCNSMPPSLDNDFPIQDLAFQVLKPFGVKNSNVRPK